MVTPLARRAIVASHCRPSACEFSPSPLLASAAERSGLSARAYHRVLKVARTIADLDDATAVAWTHVAEALRYRPLDSKDLGEASMRCDATDPSANDNAGSSKLAPRTRAARATQVE